MVSDDLPGEHQARFAVVPRGTFHRRLVIAFQAAWMGYSALMWGIEVGCIRSPYEAKPQGAALTLRTQHSPGFAAYQPCCMKKVAVGYRPSVAMVG